MIFFQQYRAKQPKEIDLPTVPPPLPNGEETKAIDTVKPIHLDDAQYILLTRALRPGVAPVREGLEAGPTGPNVPVVAEKASPPPAPDQPCASPEQPAGAPIV